MWTGQLNLPRLLYVGDVPIEETYHGSAVLYRLLKRYPSERLLVIEAGPTISDKSRRLSGVDYKSMPLPAGRLLYSRCHRWAASWFLLRANRRTRALEASLKDFAPDAVLTVAHGFSWITAAELAAYRNIPLHLVVHDDLPHMINLVGPAKAWLGNRFANIYKQASSRLCVSPFMVEEYQKRYGRPGTVLYPLRSTVGGSFEEAPQPSNNRPFTVAFAGSLSVGDYIRQLACLSQLLLNMPGRLLILGPAEHDVLSKKGVALECVTLRGYVPPRKFIKFLRAEADVLFVPMSFESYDRIPFAVNFPSKLIEYTAAALPLLIWGPSTSSAVKWATREFGVAAVVSDPGEAAMGVVLNRLAEDAEWRSELGRKAAIAGRKHFSPDKIEDSFYHALRVA